MSEEPAFRPARPTSTGAHVTWRGSVMASSVASPSAARTAPPREPRPAPTEHQSGTGAARHTLAAPDGVERLSTRMTGLASAEAAERLQIHGPNELQALARTSAWHTFAAQYQNVLILILLAATVISGFLGHTLEAVVITIIVLFA